MEGSPAEQTSSLRGGSGTSPSPDAIAWGLLGLSLLIHLLLVPARGWERDLYWFATWMRTSLEAGAAHVADKVWCDYPPGYIYLLETVAVGGIALQHFYWPTGILFAIGVGFQLLRLRYEERVLTRAFPGYIAYAARTARLIPGLY